MENPNLKVRRSYSSGSQTSPDFSNAYRNLAFLRVGNSWNNFDSFSLWQFEAESDSLRNYRTELLVLPHLDDVFVGDGWLNDFAVARLAQDRSSTYRSELPAIPYSGCRKRGNWPCSNLAGM